MEVGNMSYAERKRLAVEHVRELRDQGRDAREFDDEERLERALDDKEETARHVEANPLSELACESPGRRRALEHAREWFAEHRPDRSDEDELDAVFGPVDDRGDEDDGAVGDIWG